MIHHLRTLVRAQWEHLVGCALTVSGLVLMVFGIRQVSEATSLVDQLSFLMSTGVFGLGLVAVGVGLFISGDLHEEWRRLDRLEAALERRPDDAGDNPVAVQSLAEKPQSFAGDPVR